MTKHILIATGGTGGHVYPAMALAAQLKRVNPTLQVSFAGGDLSQNPYFDAGDCTSHDIEVATFRSGDGILGRFTSGLKVLRGMAQSRRLLKELKPDVVVGFGSYHTFPILSAARSLKIPVVLHEANSRPGRVNARFSSYARVTGIQFPEAAHDLKGRTMEVSLPLRDGYSLAFGSRRKALEYYGLDPDLMTFLVFGGSQGALAINMLFCSAASHHLAQASRQFQVIHITGGQGVVTEVEKEYEENGIRACVKAFEERMDQAWLAADLAITRAGASTIAEQMEFEVPAIYIPYPHAKDRHQDRNAAFVSEQVRGAIKLEEEGLEPEALAEVIRGLVKQDHKSLSDMKRSLQEYKETHRARDLCSVVCEVGGIR